MINMRSWEAQSRIDRRRPDGVTIIAPFEQATPDQYPGIEGGAEAKAGLLFDLEADPGEQKDLASRNPEVVKRLMALFNATQAEVPEFAPHKSDYRFRDPEPGESPILMRNIGGELRYDRLPASQQHLIVK